MSEKPPEITVTAASGQGQSTAGEGKITLTGDQLEQATVQYCVNLVKLDKNRHKPDPMRDVDKIKEILAMGLSVKDEMETLGASRSTINSYRKKYGPRP